MGLNGLGATDGVGGSNALKRSFNLVCEHRQKGVGDCVGHGHTTASFGGEVQST
jgi:hypothetical protein